MGLRKHDNQLFVLCYTNKSTSVKYSLYFCITIHGPDDGRESDHHQDVMTE